MPEEGTVVNEPAEQAPAPTESTPAENNTPEPAEDKLLETLNSDESKPTEVETPKSEETPSEEPEEAPKEEPTEEQPKGKAEERKQQLNSEIRGLVEQRKALREEVEKLNTQVYRPQTAQELEQEGYSPESARITALEQQIELQNFNNQVVEAQMSLGEQSQQILSDFPMFNPDSEDFDAEIAASAAAALDASLIRDPNTGTIIGSHLPPIQIYKPIADAYQKSKTQGQIQGQRATAEMLARSETSTSNAPQKPKEDPLLAILKSDDI